MGWVRVESAAIAEEEGALQPGGGGLTPSSHEREPNCRDRRWQNAVYSDSNHPLAPTPGEPHAAPSKQERRRPTDRARVVVLPRPPRERRRAGERAAEDRHCDLRRRLLLVRGSRFRPGRRRDQHHLALHRRAPPPPQ